MHSELAVLRNIQGTQKEPAVVGPGWFVQMDVNRDNDLTRKEFPGTDAQFKELDTDDDELISATEANTAAKNKDEK